MTVKPTIPIVDDTPDMVAIVDRLLRAHYRTRTASSGKEALNKALAEPPDLVLLDVIMPGMSGFDVCRQLKSRAETKEVPVIFLTALDDAGDEKAGFDAGGIRDHEKPHPARAQHDTRGREADRGAGHFLAPCARDRPVSPGEMGRVRLS